MIQMIKSTQVFNHESEYVFDINSYGTQYTSLSSIISRENIQANITIHTFEPSLSSVGVIIHKNGGNAYQGTLCIYMAGY